MTDNAPTPRTICGLSLDVPRIMGILNVTPDSFSDGGQFNSVQAAIDRAADLKDQGADIIDIGGESTRPGADEITISTEINRVLPVIKGCIEAGLGPVSIDTRKAAVMRAAITAGAALINDISALTFDRDSLSAAAQTRTPVVLMHALGTPQTMQHAPAYTNVVDDVYTYLADRIDICMQAGINRTQIIIDPGIGFGKTLAHNLQLLVNLSRFHALGCPVLLGASRKSFIGKIDGSRVNDRLAGSLTAVAKGYAQGVQLFRVHDVKETRQCLNVLSAMESAGAELSP